MKERERERERERRCRLDLAVRYLAIDSYFGRSSSGWDLYIRMQSNRVGPGYGELSQGRFEALIESYIENGYDKESEVELGSDLMPIDGMHRLALALYFGVEEIPCQIRPYKMKILYDVPWFESNGFSAEEIRLILSTMEKLCQA